MNIFLLGACAASLTMQKIDLPAHARVLFQGDSITDMNRGRTDDPNHILGHSYAFLIAAQTGAAFPERRIEFINRGVSGNKVADMAARWQADTIDLKPTILSILIGINDVDSEQPMEKFEADYDALLIKTEAALPNTQLVLCEPFGLPSGWRAPKWPQLHARIEAAQQMTERLAKKHHAIFVPLQKVFNNAWKKAPAEYWIWDSIHPTYSGQQLIADQWVKVVGKQLKHL